MRKFTELARSLFTNNQARRDIEAEQRFDQQHREILHKYYEPEKWPSPEKVVYSVVVPASAEITNGNFWRMVESLSQLDDATKTDEFEILFVINNLDPNENKARFLENQIHLKILEGYRISLQDGNNEPCREVCTSLGVPEYVIDILETCLDRKVRLLGVDASSNNRHIKFDSEFDFAPGHGRNIGGHIASERMRGNSEQDGFIDYKDADVSFPPHYFQSNDISPSTESLSFAVDVTPTLFPEFDTEKWSELTEIQSTVDFYVAELLAGNKGALTYIPTDYNTQSIIVQMERYMEGPQLGVSGSTFKKTAYPVAGYRGEDYQAVYDTKKVIRQPKFSNRLPVITLVPGKYDTSSLLNWDSKFSSVQIDNHNQAKCNEFLWNMARLYRLYKNDTKFLRILEHECRVEQSRRQKSFDELKLMIHVIYGSATENDPEAEYLLDQHSSLAFLITKLKQEQYTEDEAVEYFIIAFPQLFGQFAEKPDYDKLETLADQYPKNKTDLNPRDFMHILRSAYLVVVNDREEYIS